MSALIPDCDYTFKNYYFPASPDLSGDDEPQVAPTKVKQNTGKRSIDAFFEKPKVKKPRKQSSNVARANGDGTSYISANSDDGAYATHLIKIDVFDMKKLKNIQPIDHWKHADVRVKYYVTSEDDKLYQTTSDLIYNITKQVATKDGCTKFFLDADKK